MDKILIVDDEQLVVETLQAALSDLQYELVSTRNPEEAVSLFVQQHPFLVLLDINMLPINGLEVVRKVTESQEHSLEQNKDYFIVILTGAGSSLMKQECRELGIQIFLNKPIHVNVLRKTVESIHHIYTGTKGLKQIADTQV